MKVAVVTVSDRASAGVYPDESGPAIEDILREGMPDLELKRLVVPDGAGSVAAALASLDGYDWIFTTGGTGPAPRDQTPEGTRLWMDRELPGIADYLRTESLKETPTAVFSRGLAGMRGRCYVVNFPGSVRAAGFCARLMLPLLKHGTDMAGGCGH